VARLLASTDLRLVPGDFMFAFADTHAADHDALPPLPIQTGHWISAGPSTAIIESLQQRHEVRLRLECFDGPPDDDSDDWEVADTVTLQAVTGRITITTWTSGQIRDVLTLPAPGLYQARVTGRNRELVAREHEALYTEFDIDDPGFEAARQQLAGKETYRVVFWPATLRPA
jgi:hypothetical protein